MPEKSIPERITVSFFVFKLSKKTFINFFMLMVNLRYTDDSRYTRFREIMDRDILDLQCMLERTLSDSCYNHYSLQNLKTYIQSGA